MPLFVLLILLAPIASFLWQFHRVHRGLSSRSKGILSYAGYSAIPVVLYLGAFLVLVGFEELLNTSLVSEAYARSLVIVCVGGATLIIVGTIAFSIAVAFTKRKGIRQ